MPPSAIPCTNTTTDEQAETADAADIHDHLLDALTRLGDSDPAGLLARYPADRVRAWLAYCRSPAARGLRNKPGFIRARLKQGQPAPATPSPPNTPTPSPHPTAQPIACDGPPFACDGPPFVRDGPPFVRDGPPFVRDSPEPDDPLYEDPTAVEARHKWQRALDLLELQMTRQTFNAWLEPTYALGLADGQLLVQVENPYAKQWLEKRLNCTIQRALATIDPEISVQFVLPPAITDDPQPP